LTTQSAALRVNGDADKDKKTKPCRTQKVRGKETQRSLFLSDAEPGKEKKRRREKSFPQENLLPYRHLAPRVVKDDEGL
jgi:hypothetical protein